MQRLNKREPTSWLITWWRSGGGRTCWSASSLKRSLEMVVGLLGIFKAGGAYVPLDPAYLAREAARVLAIGGRGRQYRVGTRKSESQL